jgi:hypothetical protein
MAIAVAEIPREATAKLRVLTIQMICISFCGQMKIGHANSIAPFEQVLMSVNGSIEEES